MVVLGMAPPKAGAGTVSVFVVAVAVSSTEVELAPGLGEVDLVLGLGVELPLLLLLLCLGEVGDLWNGLLLPDRFCLLRLDLVLFLAPPTTASLLLGSVNTATAGSGSTSGSETAGGGVGRVFALENGLWTAAAAEANTDEIRSTAEGEQLSPLENCLEKKDLLTDLPVLLCLSFGVPFLSLLLSWLSSAS